MKNFLYLEYPEIFNQIASSSLEDESLDIYKLRLGSSKKLFWVCEANKDHIWQTAVNKRALEKTGCPYCSGAKVTRETSLATTHPNIAKEWHSELNNALTPYDVRAGSSSKKIYWQCLKDKDHIWKTTVDSRTGRNAGNCPFCSNQRLSKTNSIAFLYPEIAKDWHPTLNGTLTPHDVIGGSNKRIHWLCDKSAEHVWSTTAFGRTKAGTGCPYCSNRKLCSDNSLQAVYPELAKEWDYEGNYPLKPNGILSGAKKAIHWTCSKGPDHKWTAFLDNRVAKGRGCPCCSGAKLSKDNSLAFKYPLVAAGWHPTLNGDLTPEGITSRSGKRVYWQCLNNDEHVWQAAIDTRVLQNQWCPSCKTPKIQTEICEALSSLHGDDWKDSKIKLNRIGFTKGIAQIDMLLLTEHRKVVVEYDGLYWHKDKIVKDINTTNALMEAGYLVIRLRECTNRQNLPLLSLDDKRFMQIQFNYDEKATPGYTDTVCQDIYDFIENFYRQV